MLPFHVGRMAPLQPSCIPYANCYAPPSLSAPIPQTVYSVACAKAPFCFAYRCIPSCALQNCGCRASGSPIPHAGGTATPDLGHCFTGIPHSMLGVDKRPKSCIMNAYATNGRVPARLSLREPRQLKSGAGRAGNMTRERFCPIGRAKRLAPISATKKYKTRVVPRVWLAPSQKAAGLFCLLPQHWPATPPSSRGGQHSHTTQE